MITCKWKDCGKAFFDNLEIVEHVESHIGYPKKNTFNPRCQWDLCNVSKTTRGAMVSHLAVHIDVRPYPCPCGKSFKRKYDRIVHQRKCRADELPENQPFRDPLKEICAQFEMGRNTRISPKEQRLAMAGISNPRPNHLPTIGRQQYFISSRKNSGYAKYRNNLNTYKQNGQPDGGQLNMKEINQLI